MAWETNYCTPRLASPGLTVNPLLNSAGGCYAAPDGGPTMYLSAYDIANSRRSNIRPAGSMSGMYAVRRATTGALFNAPMVGTSMRGLGTLGDIAQDMCNANTQRDMAIGTAIGGALLDIGRSVVTVAGQNAAPGDNTWRDVGTALTTGQNVATGLQQGYRALCDAVGTGNTPATIPNLAAYQQLGTPAARAAAAVRPAAGLSTGAKVAIGVGGAGALAALAFFLL